MKGLAKTLAALAACAGLLCAPGAAGAWTDMPPEAGQALMGEIMGNVAEGVYSHYSQEMYDRIDEQVTDDVARGVIYDTLGPVDARIQDNLIQLFQGMGVDRSDVPGAVCPRHSPANPLLPPNF